MVKLPPGYKLVLPDPSKVKSDSHLKQGLIVKEAVTFQPAGVVWKGADEQHEVRHYHVFYMHGLGPISLASS